jgi:hypothetical protein
MHHAAEHTKLAYRDQRVGITSWVLMALRASTNVLGFGASYFGWSRKIVQLLRLSFAVCTGTTNRWYYNTLVSYVYRFRVSLMKWWGRCRKNMHAWAWASSIHWRIGKARLNFYLSFTLLRISWVLNGATSAVCTVLSKDSAQLDSSDWGQTAMDAWMLPSFAGSNCNFVFVDVTMSPAIASCRHIHIPSNSNFCNCIWRHNYGPPAMICDCRHMYPSTLQQLSIAIVDTSSANCNCSFWCIPHEFIIAGFSKVATANHLQLLLFRQELKTISLNVCSIRPTQIHKPTWNLVITTLGALNIFLEKLNTSHIQGTKLRFTPKKVSLYFSQSIAHPSALQLSLYFQIWD